MPLERSAARGIIAVAGIAMAVAAAAPALAYHSSSTTGSFVYTSGSNDNTVNVNDNVGDSKSAYGLYYVAGTSSQGRLNNGNGNGTTVSKSFSTNVTTVQACLDVQLRPDTCGPWG